MSYSLHELHPATQFHHEKRLFRDAILCRSLPPEVELDPALKDLLVRIRKVKAMSFGIEGQCTVGQL